MKVEWNYDDDDVLCGEMEGQEEGEQRGFSLVLTTIKGLGHEITDLNPLLMYIW